MKITFHALDENYNTEGYSIEADITTMGDMPLAELFLCFWEHVTATNEPELYDYWYDKIV